MEEASAAKPSNPSSSTCAGAAGTNAEEEGAAPAPPRAIVPVRRSAACGQVVGQGWIKGSALCERLKLPGRFLPCMHAHQPLLTRCLFMYAVTQPNQTHYFITKPSSTAVPHPLPHSPPACARPPSGRPGSLRAGSSSAITASRCRFCACPGEGAQANASISGPWPHSCCARACSGPRVRPANKGHWHALLAAHPPQGPTCTTPGARGPHLRERLRRVPVVVCHLPGVLLGRPPLAHRL